MIHPPFSKGRLFEVSLYNQDVSGLLLKTTKVIIYLMIIGLIVRFTALLRVMLRKHA